MKKIYPIILSGGSGTRLWPFSRKMFPKQFLPFDNNDSLFTKTLKRFHGRNFHKATIISNYIHRFLVKDSIEKSNIQTNSILLEPMMKNTSAAVTLSTLYILKKDPNAVILISPSDHLVEEKKFKSFFLKNFEKFDKKFLYIFGIKPTEPNPSYGYILKGNKIKSNFFYVKKFFEKPKVTEAKRFLKTESFYWNSGIFLFSATTFVNEMKLYSPKILKTCEQLIDESKKQYEFITFPEKKFTTLQKKPIDKDLFEKTKKAVVVPFNFNWSDAGSWESIWKIKKKKKNQNVLDGNIIIENVKRSFIKTHDKSIAVVVGVNDLVIIKDKDALLVTKKNYHKNIKDILYQIKKKDKEKFEFGTIVYRPWGSFENIRSGDGFLVKILKINPKSKISLQYHKKRSEHWVVTKGTATITLNEKKIKLKEKESIFVKLGEKHRIENKTKDSLEIVEVQIGKVLDESDIVRIDDIYGRK